MTASPGMPARPTPTSFSYTRGLLFLQAACWGLMSLLAIYWAVTTKSAPRGGIPLLHHPIWDLGVAATCAALSGAKAWLGALISQRSGGTRRLVIAVECLMVGFAVVLCLLTANLDGGFIPFWAGAIGGIMSLIAAILLTRPPARQYFARPQSDSAPSKTVPPHRSHGPLFAIPA